MIDLFNIRFNRPYLKFSGSLWLRRLRPMRLECRLLHLVATAIKANQ